MSALQRAKSRECELDGKGSGLLPVAHFDARQLVFFNLFHSCLLLFSRVRKIAKTDY